MPQAPRAARNPTYAGGGIGLRRDKQKDQSHGYHRIRDEARGRPLRGRAQNLFTDKASASQPDYRVLSQGIEVGAGWNRIRQMSGKEYVSLSISAPEFGSKTLYANLGRATGQTDPAVYALIWNPQD